jgi:hypothetical protein
VEGNRVRREDPELSGEFCQTFPGGGGDTFPDTAE